ncbi:MAG: hypothetical protein CM1200mP41_05300 [Gammaproteobacteria bacterium]|nr:MAG: hypothetical protein CM1200mP41_05300 [Gammaproteobacteria bacterium]
MVSRVIRICLRTWLPIDRTDRGGKSVASLSYELIPDRAGIGEYRGEYLIDVTIGFWKKKAVLQVRSDRRRIRPYGLYGGRPGKPSCNILNPDRNAQVWTQS